MYLYNLLTPTVLTFLHGVIACEFGSFFEVVTCTVVDWQVEKSKQFRREGSDIHTEVAISVAQAILGGSVKVPGIGEDLLVEVCWLLISCCKK